MQPSATKEQQPVVIPATSAENQIQLTHTDNFDPELVKSAQAELGEEVKTPSTNEPVVNKAALADFYKMNGLREDGITESLIGEAGVRKDIPEIPQEKAESLPNKVISAFNNAREAVYHGYLKRGSRIRFNKSKDNLKKLQERSELLGQKLKVHEVLHAPKKVELPDEQQPEAVVGEITQPEPITAEASSQPLTESTPVTSATSEQNTPQSEQTPPTQNAAHPEQSTQAAASVSTDESSQDAVTPAQKSPVDLDTYRKTGEITSISEQPPHHEISPVTHPLVANAPVDLEAYRVPVSEVQEQQPPVPQSQAA